MNEQGIKNYFVGRDGFSWWIGQIAPQKEWEPNLPGHPTRTSEEQKGFDFRYKVRIMGYHTSAGADLPDVDLPWATVMLPVTAGVSGGGISTPNLRQGDFVYGFFLDGEDAQMPIIMGTIGHNQYTAILKDPDAEKGFLPFSGFTVEDQVPQWQLRTDKEEPKAVAKDIDASKTNNKEVAESAVNSTVSRQGASLEQYKNESKPVTIAANADCEQAPVVGIQREIKNMIAEVQRLQKTATDWETKVSTKINNVESEIAKVKDNATKAITGHVKRITTEIQKNTTKKINDTLSDSYDKLFPTELPQLKEEVEKANDELACAFRNIIKNLSGMIGNFLNQIADRFINTPLCAVENSIGSLLGKISGLIDSAVQSVMGPIKALLAGMGVASSGLDDVMGFATDALSFLNCDENPKCSDVKEWNPVNGPEISATLDLFSIVSKAKQAARLVEGAVSDFANLGDAINDIAKNADFPGVFADTCNVGPVFCGPPRVEFIGGGGSGATGNVIVSALTTVLGVDIITPGGGYIGPPRLKFIDSCNQGKGATGRAVVENGEVVKVIIDDTGIDYLPIPDGSQGGDGRTWADRDETTVKRSDGTYDTPYQPGTNIPLLPGDEWTPAGGGGPIIITESETVTAPSPPPLPTTAADTPITKPFPTFGTGDYPVVLEIDDINIQDSGFGYDPNKDKVIIKTEDGTSKGAELKIKTDPLGSVIGVDVINGGIGFNQDPDIYIQSDTGYNAKLMPVFKVNRVGEDVDLDAVSPIGVIQVIDCVGRT